LTHLVDVRLRMKLIGVEEGPVEFGGEELSNSGFP
jgi:hypothetical protein